MSDFTLSYPEPKNEAEYQTVMQLLRTEMEGLNQKMAEDRKDIERIEAETDVIRAERHLLEKETEQIKQETRALFAHLGGAF